MKRREFIKAAGVIAAGTTAARGLALGSDLLAGTPLPDKKPNILFIMTDQQSSDALSCRMGNTWLKTPAMDSLAARGLFFNRAYTANPLCVPARTALFTGQCSHVTGVQTNDITNSLAGKYPTLGTIFRDAGYDNGYFGKWHQPFPAKEKVAHGFDTMGAIKNNGVDKEIPALAREFTRRKREKPFLLVTSFVNPHNICEWARGQELPDGNVGDPPSLDQCPPMVKNHLPMEDEPPIAAFMRRSFQANPLFPVGDFDEKKWREYRWAYFRLIEKVDAEIGEILQALRESGQYENTLIVLTADHGDMQGAHKWSQKTVLFDESSRVPFIIAPPGGIKAETSSLLVNTGIDLLPTLCEYAGIEIPAKLPGMSVKAAADGKAAASARPYVVTENKMAQGMPIDGNKPEPNGRMVRSRRFKYCAWDIGERSESLVDMENDPGEMVNLAGKKEHQQTLEQHKQYLAEWCQKTRDAFAIPR